MTFMLIPEIDGIVLSACKDLIEKFNFFMLKKQKNEVLLLSEKCAIRIIAGVSPIGEQQIETDFFDPSLQEGERRYFSHTFLLYLKNRSEPRDILKNCRAEKETFEETIRASLRCFTAHTLKYRQDILKGDFVSWLPGKT